MCPFESERVRHDWLEVNSADSDATIRVRATVVLTDDSVSAVDGFDKGVRAEDRSTYGVRRVLREARGEKFLEKFTRPAAGAAGRDRAEGKCAAR